MYHRARGCASVCNSQHECSWDVHQLTNRETSLVVQEYPCCEACHGAADIDLTSRLGQDLPLRRELPEQSSSSLMPSRSCSGPVYDLTHLNSSSILGAKGNGRDQS